MKFLFNFVFVAALLIGASWAHAESPLLNSEHANDAFYDDLMNTGPLRPSNPKVNQPEIRSYDRSRFCEFLKTKQGMRLGSVAEPQKPATPEAIQPTPSGQIQVEAPDTYEFNLNLDLSERQEFSDLIPEGIEANNFLGTFTFKNDEVYLQGQKLNNNDREALESLCQDGGQ